MKILILNPYNPFPVNSGGKMRTWFFAETLGREHEVSILYPPERSDAQDPGEEIRRHFKHVLISDYQRAPGGNQPLSRRFSNLAKGIPWEIAYQYMPNLGAALLKAMREHRFDAILARYLTGGAYVLEHRDRIKARIIIDVDDLEFIKSGRQMGIDGHSGWYDRFRRRFNNWLLWRYNRSLRGIDKALVCSEHDRALMERSFGLRNLEVVPNSIDVSTYATVTPYSDTQARSKILLFAGTLHYEPNVDAARWFVKDILPLILAREPGVQVHFVGAYRKKKPLGLADGKNIFCFHNVPEMAPYYERCSAVIVPLRVGGGTRIKILEAFACSRPVVSTSVGAEGLGVADGRECLLADTPQAFADACLRLLSSPQEAGLIARSGRRYVGAFDAKNVAVTVMELFRENHG